MPIITMHMLISMITKSSHVTNSFGSLIHVVILLGGVTADLDLIMVLIIVLIDNIYNVVLIEFTRSNALLL